MKTAAVVVIRTLRRTVSSLKFLSLVTNATKTGKPRNGGNVASRIAGDRISQPYASQGLRYSVCIGCRCPVDRRRRRAINSPDVSRAHDRARGVHHDAGAGQARGGRNPERVGHREGQRDTRRNRRLPPLLPPRRLRAHPDLRQEDQSLRDLSRLQRPRRQPRAVQEVLHHLRLRQRHQRLQPRSRLREERQVLYDAHGRSQHRGAGRPAEHDVPGLAHLRLHDDRADYDAGTGDASGRVDRVDRHESRRTTRSKARRASCSACG